MDSRISLFERWRSGYNEGILYRLYLKLEKNQMLDRDGKLELGDSLFDRGLFKEAYQYLSDSFWEEEFASISEEDTQIVLQERRIILLAKSLDALNRRSEAITLLYELFS